MEVGSSAARVIMTFENVDLFISDKTALATPIAGVIVKVMNQSGAYTFSFAQSDLVGKVSLLLPSDQTYQLRFFKQHVSFSNPIYITVEQAPIANTFDIHGEPFEAPVSSDPRLCVASGFFRRPDGSPAPNVDMQFIAKFDPVLLEGDAVLVERVTIRTDSKGYAQVSLIRCAQYDVTIQGFEDSNRIVNVPEQASVNLPDLLFPVVSQILFDPPPPFAISSGQEITVTPTVVTTDGRILEGTAVADVFWSSSDINILGLTVAATTLNLRGSDVGLAAIQAVRSDTSIIRIPNTPIVGVPATIIVS